MGKDEKLINVVLGTRRTVRVARRGRWDERPTTTPSGPLPQNQDRQAGGRKRVREDGEAGEARQGAKTAGPGGT